MSVVSPQSRAWVLSVLKDSKKSIIGITVVIAVMVIVAYTVTPPVPDSTVRFAKTSKVLSWASSKASCDSGTPSKLAALNSTHYTYECTDKQLDRKSVTALAIVASSFVLMVGNHEPDLTMLFATFLLLLFDVVTPAQGTLLVLPVTQFCLDRTFCFAAWAGFSNTGVLTVAAMFVIAKCIEVNGTLDLVTRLFLGRPSSHIVAQLRVFVPVTIASAFVANTPLVAAMMPIIASWTTRIRKPVTQFMIPLSFASMIGGMCTLLGTSTNLVAAALLEAHDPAQV